MLDIFKQMGLAMLIPEDKIAATTAMTSCGIEMCIRDSHPTVDMQNDKEECNCNRIYI